MDAIGRQNESVKPIGWQRSASRIQQQRDRTTLEDKVRHAYYAREAELRVSTQRAMDAVRKPETHVRQGVPQIKVDAFEFMYGNNNQSVWNRLIQTSNEVNTSGLYGDHNEGAWYGASKAPNKVDIFTPMFSSNVDCTYENSFTEEKTHKVPNDCHLKHNDEDNSAELYEKSLSNNLWDQIIPKKLTKTAKRRLFRKRAKDRARQAIESRIE